MLRRSVNDWIIQAHLQLTPTHAKLSYILESSEYYINLFKLPYPYNRVRGREVLLKRKHKGGDFFFLSNSHNNAPKEAQGNASMARLAPTGTRSTCILSNLKKKFFFCACVSFFFCSTLLNYYIL